MLPAVPAVRVALAEPVAVDGTAAGPAVPGVPAPEAAFMPRAVLSSPRFCSGIWRVVAPTEPPTKLILPAAEPDISYESVSNDLSWRAWRNTDCIDSRVLVIEVRPLSAASSVWMPLAIESIRELRSPARALSEEAVKKLVGLSRAELTLLPVDRRFWVFSIRLAVLWSESRFDRTAFEREISDMVLPSMRRRWSA